MAVGSVSSPLFLERCLFKYAHKDKRAMIRGEDLARQDRMSNAIATHISTHTTGVNQKPIKDVDETLKHSCA